jgi:hypothetical protein
MPDLFSGPVQLRALGPREVHLQVHSVQHIRHRAAGNLPSLPRAQSRSTRQGTQHGPILHKGHRDGQIRCQRCLL